MRTTMAPVGLESLSGRHGEVDQVSAVRDPANLVQLGTTRSGFSGGDRWRVPVQRRMDSCVVVIGLEVSQLPLEISCIPEQHMVEKLSAHRPNQALDEGVRQGTCGTVLISSISKIRRFACHRCASNSGS